jgi:hypothetical protein
LFSISDQVFDSLDGGDFSSNRACDLLGDSEMEIEVTEQIASTIRREA